jgi:hypothetical protein
MSAAVSLSMTIIGPPHFADFQVCQLGVAHSGGIERQQQNAMVGSERRIDSASQRFNPQGSLEACRNRFDQLDSNQGVGT